MLTFLLRSIRGILRSKLLKLYNPEPQCASSSQSPTQTSMLTRYQRFRYISSTINLSTISGLTKKFEICYSRELVASKAFCYIATHDKKWLCCHDSPPKLSLIFKTWKSKKCTLGPYLRNERRRTNLVFFFRSGLPSSSLHTPSSKSKATQCMIYRERPTKRVSNYVVAYDTWWPCDRGILPESHCYPIHGTQLSIWYM